MSKFKPTLLLSILLAMMGWSCTSQESNDGEVLHQRKVYEQAIKLGDAETAIGALINILSYDSSQVGLYDSLASLYYQVGNGRATVQAADALLAKQPNNERMLLLGAKAFARNNIPEPALEYYDRLYKIKPGPDVQYQRAALLLTLGDLKGADSALKLVTMHPSSPSMSVVISTSQPGVPGQEVTLLAAAQNVLGTLRRAEGNISAAKAAYAEAIRLQPDFGLAKANAQELNKNPSK